MKGEGKEVAGGGGRGERAGGEISHPPVIRTQSLPARPRDMPY